MVRRRADESAPAVEDGIEERVIRHARTKRGIRTTEKVVPVLSPVKKKSSHSKGKKGQLGPESAEGSGNVVPPSNDQFNEPQVDGFHDSYVEQNQPPSYVCAKFHFI